MYMFGKLSALVGLSCCALAPTVDAAIIARYEATTLGLANGTSVSTWNGTSGAGPALSATGTAQPTYNATGMNGRPTVTFDGSSDVLKSGTALNNAKTIVAVT